MIRDTTLGAKLWAAAVWTLVGFFVINLLAMISLNIGIFNLLPIPMLDGGHLVFYLYEAARGRPLSERMQEIGFRLGLALVLTLTVFTFANDLYWVFNKG